MSDYEPISVAITTYNGLELLGKYLPTIKSELNDYPGGGEIIIVDDCGADSTMKWLESEHPDVKAFRNDKNSGFATTANRCMQESSNEITVLLNNDMSLEKGFIEPLVDRIRSDDDIFSVTAKSVIEGGGNESVNYLEMDDGMMHLRQPGLDGKKEFDRPVTILNAGGGYSAFRRDRFLELGGFDPIYHPGYWEDVDISFKAWKNGWKCVYEPAAALGHHSHGTIGDLFTSEQYDLIHYSHMHLFHMVNLEDADLERYLARSNRLMSEINLFDRGVLRRGFFRALARLDEILERRKKIGTGRSLEEIIEESSNKPLGHD